MPSELQRLLVEATTRLREEANTRKGAAAELARISKDSVLTAQKKLGQALKKMGQKISPEQLEQLGLQPLMSSLNGYLDNFEDVTRKQLGQGLKEACANAGLQFKVISRDEPTVVRIPPVAVSLDFKKGKASICFARQVVEQCPLSVKQIMATREKSLKILDTRFDQEKFFQACYRAYLRCLKLTDRSQGERVELNEFLPELAFIKQAKGFREDPLKKNYNQYGKAEFAYDVLRLRRAGGLEQQHRRINFGVATGTTATQKKRVIYLEDEEGIGEFKLTIFFTATGGK